LNGIKAFTEAAVNENRTANLVDYLENVSLLTDLDNDKPEDRNKVTIMTMHSAKGLEFNNVYIVGLEEELFPSKMAFESPEELEEERRLFYVAITRARKRVNISSAQNRYRWGTPTSSQPSRFLRDIDPKYLELPAENSGRQPAKNYDREDAWDYDYSGKSQPGKAPFVGKLQGNSLSKQASVKSGLIIPKKQVPLRRPSNEDFKHDNPDLVQPGMKVEHNLFGIGKVLQIEGASPNRKATVFFQEQGEEKQLLLKFAKLRIVTGENQ
jgi:DNA helicase-2/ATP-dependent DNA helicase PcrA